MNASPTDFAVAGQAESSGRLSPSSRWGQWEALHDAAAAVAAMAGLAAERPTAQVRDFPAMIEDAGGWRFELARNGIADMSAMMRPGVTALLAVTARGQDPTAAALSLWREYHHARAALLGLIPEHGIMEPAREA
jgi:hypothetical protein